MATVVPGQSRGATADRVGAQPASSTDRVYGPTGLAILKDDHAVPPCPSGHLANGSYEVTIFDMAKSHYSWRFKVGA